LALTPKLAIGSCAGAARKWRLCQAEHPTRVAGVGWIRYILYSRFAIREY
jgi:hypothetical protein